MQSHSNKGKNIGFIYFKNIHLNVHYLLTRVMQKQKFPLYVKQMYIPICMKNISLLEYFIKLEEFWNIPLL